MYMVYSSTYIVNFHPELKFCRYFTGVFEGQEDIYSKVEDLNNLFLFKFPDTLRFTQGRWKFEKLGLDPKEGNYTFIITLRFYR